MNIVYGGSFNPVTLAHKEIVLNLIKKFSPNKVIIVPCGNNYNRKSLIDFSYRYEMLKLTMDIKDVVISDIESKTDNYKGTLYTLNKLSEYYDDLYFVMGADNLVTIKTWINYETLLKNYNFIIFKRSNIDIYKYINDELYKFRDKFHIIEYNNLISSSIIREDINSHKDLLDDKCYKYIIKNNLYKEGV